MGGAEHIWRRGWLCALALVGCAGGDPVDSGVTAGLGLGEGGGSTAGGWWTDGPPPSESTTSGFPGGSTEGEGDEDPGFPPDLGTCSGPADCVIENTTCYLEQGACVGGMCQFDAKAAGSGCNDADPCTDGDVCDGFGICAGTPKQCVGGECVMGQCTVSECEAGSADCNEDPTDGCEVTLGTGTNCNSCGDSCDAGPNASGSCVAQSCEFDCAAGFGNCDGDWSNGCEIPLGANQCDAGGLNPNGCWTSYCGNSGNADAVNFGTWYCFECTTCNVPSAGQCQWCDHASGTWFPAESCACGSFEGLTCGS